jgi:hypothetical protein
MRPHWQPPHLTGVFAAGYHRKGLKEAKQDLVKKLLEHAAELLVPPPRARILDVGCGLGGSSMALAQVSAALQQQQAGSGSGS